MCIWFFFSSRRRHTRSYGDWSSDVCSSDLTGLATFLDVRGSRGEALLTRMFSDFRLFRLIMDEVEKTLAYVDLDLARSEERRVGKECRAAKSLRHEI